MLKMRFFVFHIIFEFFRKDIFNILFNHFMFC